MRGWIKGIFYQTMLAIMSYMSHTAQGIPLINPHPHNIQ